MVFVLFTPITLPFVYMSEWESWNESVRGGGGGWTKQKIIMGMCLLRCCPCVRYKCTDRTTKIDSTWCVCFPSLYRSFCVVFHPHFLFKHLSAWTVPAVAIAATHTYAHIHHHHHRLNHCDYHRRCKSISKDPKYVRECLFTRTDQHSVDINLSSTQKAIQNIYLYGNITVILLNSLYYFLLASLFLSHSLPFLLHKFSSFNSIIEIGFSSLQNISR